MAKTKEQKKEMLASYTAKLKDSTALILVAPHGLTPNETSEFKKKMMELSSSFNVVKNTIFNLALKEAGWPELETLASGPHAAVFVTQDIAGTAKELDNFMKASKGKMEIKIGVLDGEILNPEQVTELASMPTKEQSIAMIAGLMTNSIAGVANVLEDSVRSVALILNQAFQE